MKTSTELATLGPTDLTAELTRIASDARRAALDGDTVRLREIRDLLMEAAYEAGGEQARLLQVAKSFVRDLGRQELSGREQKLRQFLRDGGEQALSSCMRLLAGRPISLDGLTATEAAPFTALLDAGVLVRSGAGCWLAPEARAIAQDLIEPLVFRSWQEVEAARSAIAKVGANTDAAVELMMGRLGVDRDQASLHLTQHPIASVWRGDAQAERLRSRKLLFKAQIFRDAPPDKLSNVRRDRGANPLATATGASEELNASLSKDVDPAGGTSTMDNEAPRVTQRQASA